LVWEWLRHNKGVGKDMKDTRGGSLDRRIFLLKGFFREGAEEGKGHVEGGCEN